MNRHQYIESLETCFQLEAAGAVAGEVGMHLRTNPKEKQKLDQYRRLEACNKLLCIKALEQERIARPVLETSYYRNAIRLGQKLGSGNWSDFLDRFEATVHPDFFSRLIFDADGKEQKYTYPGVNRNLFKHLHLHELCLEHFVQMERNGSVENSTKRLQELLCGPLCQGLIAPEDPVGW